MGLSSICKARVRKLEETGGLSDRSGVGAEEVSQLHLEAVQLTEFVLLNVEALRKIVKKMDKQCGTSLQKAFVEQSLKRSPLASKGSEPFNGAPELRRLEIPMKMLSLLLLLVWLINDYLLYYKL